MGFTKALFYPTIDISNEDWLKNAVLFWDEINTIVPSSIANPYQENTTQYLADQGILKPLPVSPDNILIEELTSDTLNYLNTNEGFQLLTQGQNVSQLFDIHPEKLPYKIQHQLRNNITQEGWFRVDSNFAIFYMTLLANRICEQKSIALLTDNSLSSNLSDLVRLGNQIAIRGIGNDPHYHHQHGNQRTLNLAHGLLTNLIIQGINVSKTTSLEDVINFKNRNRDELGLFRTNISKLTKDIPKDLSFEAFKQQIEDIYKDEFLPAYNNLKKSLDGAGIKWTADNFMKVSFFSTSATAIPLTLMGLSIPQVLLAGAFVSVISSRISYNIDKKDRLRNNPYSYLLAVNKGV